MRAGRPASPSATNIIHEETAAAAWESETECPIASRRNES